jgi:Reverse transcriptase (RNA-dependent DNA polymerase)
MDVDTAFLNATLEEDIWVQIPTGTKLPEGNDGIYKLLKSLYGLKQASKCWNHLINSYLLENGYQRLEADPCIYVKEIKTEINGITTVLYQIAALHADDLILAASTKNLLIHLKKVFDPNSK